MKSVGSTSPGSDPLQVGPIMAANKQSNLPAIMGRGGGAYLGPLVITASISQCFMTKHCKKIEERDTLLFKILFNEKDKYHTVSFSSFLCQNMI